LDERRERQASKSGIERNVSFQRFQPPKH